MAIPPELKASLSCWRSGNLTYIGDRLTRYLIPDNFGEVGSLQTLNRLFSKTLERCDQPLVTALSRLNLIDRKVTEIPYKYRADKFAITSIDGARSLALQHFLTRFEIEANSLSRSHGDIDGGRRKLLDRKNFQIGIFPSVASSNRIAVNLFANLKSSGFEQVHLYLNGEVEVSDLTGTQIQKSDLGAPMSEVIERISRDASLYPEPENRVSPIKFAVSIGLPSPEHQERWLHEGINYLIIEATPDVLRLGPVVKPGFTPCANCIEQSEITNGAPSRNANFLHEGKSFEPGATFALLAASLATLEISNYLDSGESELISKSATYSKSSLYAPQITNWQFQPGCGCVKITSTRANSA